MRKWNIITYGICGILCLAVGSGYGLIYPLIGVASLGMCAIHIIKAIKNKRREDS